MAVNSKLFKHRLESGVWRVAKPYGGPKGAREKVLVVRTRPPHVRRAPGASVLESPPPPAPPARTV